MRILTATIGAAAAGGTELVNAPSGVLGTIIITGAVVGALAMIWAKLFRPALRTGREVIDIFRDVRDLLRHWKGLEGWQADVDTRFEKVEGRLDSLEGRKGTAGTTPGRGSAHPHEA